MPKLTIDGKEIEVPVGTTIIQAADKLGIDIPRYCYHPALPVSGNCRICMVEIEKQPKLQIACYTPVSDGMVVKTTSPKVLETRKTVLEFLLVNHPVDCPVCDQAGECKLQDYYMEHGKYNSRLVDVKVKKEKKAFSIGPTIMLDQERCILCTRCVRFTDNITKTSEFGVFERGDHSQLDVYPGKQLDNNYSGNVADICPVGALTDKDFRFKCRVWYLEKTKSVCPGCSMGCNITVEWDKSRPRTQKKARVMRLKPRHHPQVNDYWICDVGRYDYHFIDENRILSPQLNDDFISWEKAIDTIAQKIALLKKAGRMDRIGVIASAKLTNEDLFVIKKLFKETLGIEQIDFRVPEKSSTSDDFLLKADRNPNTAGAQTILQPSDADGTPTIIQKAKQGELDLLYVFGHDLIKLFGKDTVEQIAKKVKLFVFQGSNINETCGYAHLNLPSAVYAEKEGTFTNCQQRVQRIWPAFFPLGEAKLDWEILSLLSAKLGTPLKYQGEQEIFKDIAQTIASFSEMTYEKIADQGMVLRK
ncbi:MAG: molybdopterin-dependent oxidoreductase [Candidatus Omnitrophica bacterium]|nr:molybdopterin-dependent oxidoreductase [Candidatus Omnitrophota bacterium]